MALDPFCGHEWSNKLRQTAPPSALQANSGFYGSGKSPGMEMNNRAEFNDLRTDPFMTKAGAANLRPRIKVSVFSATDLPLRGERTEAYTSIQIPGVGKSRLNTPVDYQNWGNPVWNFIDKQVWGWIPGKPLHFNVLNKAAKTGGGCSQMLGTAHDLVLCSATLMPDQFWPDGFKRQIALHDEHGASAGQLWVEVQCFGVGSHGRGCCSWCEDSFRSCGAAFAAIPAGFMMLERQFFRALEPGYPLRKQEEMYKLVLIPFGVYTLVILLMLVVRRFLYTIAIALIVLMVLALVALIVYAYFKRKKAKGLPYTTVGVLCLLAVFLGILAGNECWNYGWQQWWWINTGNDYSATASTPPGATIDASSVSFSGATSVDGTRAAGYRINNNIYCAAPLLDPSAIGAENARVGYWAIGENCCDDFGSFTCDASRQITGGVGVAMFHHGMPCSGCNSNEFRLATKKAMGAFNLVADPSALFVRYVRHKSDMEGLYALRSLGIMFMYLAIGFLIFLALGWLCNFKGWGKPVVEQQFLRHRPENTVDVDTGAPRQVYNSFRSPPCC